MSKQNNVFNKSTQAPQTDPVAEAHAKALAEAAAKEAQGSSEAQKPADTESASEAPVPVTEASVPGTEAPADAGKTASSTPAVVDLGDLVSEAKVVKDLPLKSV